MEILGLIDIPVWILLILLLLVSVYLYQTWHFSLWTDQGVDGPKPKLFYGNVPVDTNTNFIEMMEKWEKQYGKSFGFYFFRDPAFMTADPEIVKEVMIKQFNKFTDRYSGFDRLNTDFDWMMLFNSPAPSWRRYRHLMTPAFTTGKLKALTGHMNQLSSTLSQVLKEKAKKNEDIDLKDVLSRFTMDTISATAFGLDTRLQTGQEEDTHDMVKAMRGILSNLSSQLALLLAVSFPFTAPLLRALGHGTFPPKDIQFFKDCIRTLIRTRDQQPQEAKKRVDFIQQMMDLRVGEGMTSTDLNETTLDNKTIKKLTEEEVMAQGIQIFNAGFETTASTLQFLTYSLATNPAVQEKLYTEIVEVVGDGEVTYDNIQQMKYLDCVITETTRMYPIVPFVSRIAHEPVTLKGFYIPKDVGVILSIYAITHSQDIFPDPFTFNPDRFVDNKESVMAAIPFGLGPRQCIGMRLALQEMKIAVVYMLRQVQFVACERTVKQIKFQNNPLLTPRELLIVQAKPRQ